MVIDIKQGDCLELMKGIPDESVDLIVTDPPYKITSRGNGGNSGGMFQKKIVNKGKVFNNNDISIKDYNYQEIMALKMKKMGEVLHFK